MPPTTHFACLFCKHANPVGASFCNECGAQLHLQPCQQCGAVDKRSASHCYKCGASLPGDSSSGETGEALVTDAAGRHVIADDALAPPAHQGSLWLREHTPLPEAAARAFSAIRQPPAGAATPLNLAGDPARQLVPAGNGLPPAFARALPVNPQAADSILPTAGSGHGRLLGAGALFLLVAFVIGAFFHQRQAAPQDERPAVEAATPAVAAVPDRALLPPPARAAEPVAVAVPAPVVQSAPSLAAARPADGIEALDELVATHAPARGPARADAARPAPAKGGSAVPPAPRRRAAPLRECPASVATLGLCSPDQQAGE